MKNKFALVASLVMFIVLVIGLSALKIYSEIKKTSDILNGNYYTKTTLEEAEFLGKFREGSRWWYSGGTRRSDPRHDTIYDEFKLINSGKIIRIVSGSTGGHTGEKYVTIAIIDFYSKDTDKLIYQKFVIESVKDYFE